MKRNVQKPGKEQGMGEEEKENKHKKSGVKRSWTLGCEKDPGLSRAGPE